MKVGWEFVTWYGAGTGRECQVPTCERVVHSGWVRVDRPRPQDGDPVICTQCHFHIMAGVDPDTEAETPEWEQENRTRRLEEMVNGQEP